MDIGTSKPTLEERTRVRHHLIDICDPADAYSAGRFRRDAFAAIEAIRRRGRVPLLVGGTMLYLRALTHGLAPLPEADRNVRETLDARAAAMGWPALHAELRARDPEAAARIRPRDAQRIQRALEVIELTGERLSDLQKRAVPAPFRLACFALMPVAREELYARIDRRFDEMIEMGLVEEVRALRERGDLSPELPSLRAVGYRQLWSHLAGDATFDEAVVAARQATRNLAKRQLTWLRSDPGVQWVRSLEDAQLVPISDALTGSCGKMAS
jgi:tRNA dimethylallyltransferase